MHRLNPEAFDPLLSAAFFQLPPPHVTTVQLSFSIPTNKNELNQFFETQGDQFRDGIKKLLEELKRLTKEQDIFDEKSETALEIFLEKIKYKHDGTSFAIDSVFPLFTQGIIQLAEIIEILKQEKEWSSSTKTLIKNLLHHMGSCPPGVNTYICDTRLALSSDLPTELMSFRRTLVEDVAVKIINQYSLIDSDFKIAVPSEIHYATALAVMYAKPLAVPADDDVYSKDCSPPLKMQKAFCDLIIKRLTASYVIDSILQKNHDKLTKSKPDTAFIEWLSKFGSDEKFNLDLIATMDDDYSYHFKPHADYYIRLAIFSRMMNSAILNKKALQQQTLTTIPNHNFYLPKENINLAFVETGVKNANIEPFVLFYLRHFIDDVINDNDIASQLEKLCDEDQLETLRDETARLLLMDWPDYTASHSIETQNKILLAFHHHFNQYYPLLMNMLKTSGLSDEERRIFIAEIDLKNKILHDSGLDHLLVYLSFFPPEEWQDILSKELQGMDLLHHHPVNKTIELLLACGRLNVDNLKFMLHLFANQGDGSVVPVDYLTQLFAAFNETGLSDYLVDSLAAAKQHADHIAKAIFLVKDAQLINEDIMQFLNDHPANADYLAEALILFNQGLKAPINGELFLFLAEHVEFAKKFVDCTHDASLLAWIKYFIDQEWLNTDRLKSLFLKANFIHEMIAMLGALCLLDADLLVDNFDLVLNQIQKPNQANFIKFVAEYCKNKDIRFDPEWLSRILSFEKDYPLEMDNEQLALYAATLDMTTLLKSLQLTVSTQLGQFGQFAVPIVVEDDAHPIAPRQPGLDNE